MRSVASETGWQLGDEVRRACAAAFAGGLWALSQRRVVPAHVECSLRRLEAAGAER